MKDAINQQTTIVSMIAPVIGNKKRPSRSAHTRARAQSEETPARGERVVSTSKVLACDPTRTRTATSTQNYAPRTAVVLWERIPCSIMRTPSGCVGKCRVGRGIKRARFVQSRLYIILPQVKITTYLTLRASQPQYHRSTAPPTAQALVPRVTTPRTNIRPAVP